MAFLTFHRMLRPPKKLEGSGWSAAKGRSADGSEITEEEAAFGRAVEEFKRRTGKKFPTLSDLLKVLKGMGYRRAA